MMNFLKNNIEKFLQYKKKVRGFSKESLETYEINLKEAIEHIDVVQEDKRIVVELMPYRVFISNNSKKTIAKKISIVRSFIKFLKDEGYHIKLLNDDIVKVPKMLPKPVEFEHIKNALKFANEEEELIILLLYGFGLRISELSNLKIKDIKNEWLEVTGKGDKRRNIPIISKLKKRIDIYLSKNIRNKYLFEKEGKRLNQNALRYKIDKIFKRVGLKVTPHQLRHSYATDILNAGGRITDVSKLLGHSSMATTQIYTKLDSNYKLKNYNMAHPLSQRSCLG